MKAAYNAIDDVFAHLQWWIVDNNNTTPASWWITE